MILSSSAVKIRAGVCMNWETGVFTWMGSGIEVSGGLKSAILASVPCAARPLLFIPHQFGPFAGVSSIG